MVMLGAIGLPVSAFAGGQATTACTTPLQSPAMLRILSDAGKPIAAFDFGQARYGRVLSHTFTLRNDGKGDVTVDRVISACGCVSAVLPAIGAAGPVVISPGGTAQLKVEVDTTRIPGIGSSTLLSGGEFSK